MTTLGIVGTAPEMAASALSLRPAPPPRDSIDPPPAPHVAERRAGADAAHTDEAPRDFATALAGEAAPEAAAPTVAQGERPSPVVDLDDGGDAPPDGNGLPPWLAALPLLVLPPVGDAARGTAAGGPGVSTVPPSTARAGGAPPPPSLAAAPPSASPPLAAPAAGVEVEVATTPAPAQAADAAAAPARPLEPAVNSASVASTARFAIAPATVDPPVAEPLPAAPAETARQFAQALGRAGPLPSPRAADAAPRPASVPSTAPAAATAPPELAAPVAPPLDFAVQAAVAADDAPTADLAPLPLPPAGGAPAANGAPPGQAAAATAPPALQVPLPVGAPDWDRQLGERVGVLVDQGMTSAQLKLSPAHLGPLEIRISLQGDQANVWFGTHSHATREALEAAAPRLRELLGGHGYAQVGVSVDLQQQASRQQAPPSRYEPEFPFAPAEAPAMRGATAGAAARAAGRTRLDAFA